MNWKKFLKPDRNRLSVFIIIVVLSNLPIIGYFRYQEPVSCFVPPCPSSVEGVKLNFIFYPLFYNDRFTDIELELLDNIPIGMIISSILFWWTQTTYSYVSIGIELFLLLIINIFYWYILASLIVWIYDKEFKKTKRK